MSYESENYTVSDPQPSPSHSEPVPRRKRVSGRILSIVSLVTGIGAIDICCAAFVFIIYAAIARFVRIGDGTASYVMQYMFELISAVVLVFTCLCGIAAIITGALAKKRLPDSKLAKAGLILGIISLVVMVIAFILLIVLFATSITN